MTGYKPYDIYRSAPIISVQRAIGSRDDSMAAEWNPQDYRNLIIAITGCLSLLILVIGIMICVYYDKLSPQILGSIQGVGIGGGLTGLALIILQSIKISVSEGIKSGTPIRRQQTRRDKSET